ncbi:DUF1254 domain-containing protein [Agromyces sp. Soil535]|uniref:DUF1254 domain-containing protein n=1 Tax=Agromyces sp. Soil535 TaxID=1736390 RepID=UPI0006F41EFA|nr:DUF1254 domain-containing protein [Agromyces sp. Soil535]KRE29587.1 hypothetical protein ASG80_19300 [Agromyces sp. Soil535]
MKSQRELSEEQAAEVGAEVYVYGYALVTLEMTRRVTTNTTEPAGMRAPMGQFAHAREFPPVTYRDVPGANADTLYSVAWLDLGKEPYILDIPDAEGRYFVMGLLDGWSQVFQAPGTRSTGTGRQTYAITGPNWTGDLPAGVIQYRSATNLVWILGRIYTTGTPEDYERVHAFQDGVALVPLSAYGGEFTPPRGEVNSDIDMTTSTTTQVMNMDAAAYFKLLASLLKHNPPTTTDAPMVAKMAQIGLVPGEDWDVSALDPTVAKGLAQAPQTALTAMKAHAPNAGRIRNGWVTSFPTGVYGTDYLHRALLNWQGPGWNRPEDAVYPLTRVDADGNALNGANTYVLHFASGQLPPVNGFWSLTMYDSEGFFVPNPLDRVNLSQRDDFTFNDDGSLDLHIQHDSPGKDNEANWLPSPSGPFALFLRLYWPKDDAPSILDGSWMPPAVRVAN